MKDAKPPILSRVLNKLRAIPMIATLRDYRAAMTADNPLRGLPMKVISDASADPTEFFTHYDAYAYWVAAKIAQSGKRRAVLDIGSPKMMTAMLSAANSVTSIVLADCSDTISTTRYIKHDVADPLPLPDASCDALTSTVALTLVGLGRYGDRIDPNCLPNLVRELDRVMTQGADLFVSFSVGPDQLSFNNHWVWELETIAKIFRGWSIVEALADMRSSPLSFFDENVARFQPYQRLPDMKRGDYRVVFVHLRRVGS